MKPKVRSAMMLVLALFANPLAATPTTQSLDWSIERAAKSFEVPGFAVSVVHDGKTFYADGHGVVEVGSSVRVSGRTLFEIGSLSKAFTAAALAILVDEDKLKWDDAVIDYLPEFRMHDPWVTREFTIRDLLTHRSGLPLGTGDLLMFPDGKATPADVIRALRYLKPASSFRSQFAYDNQLYIVAGEIVARIANMPFQAFVEQRLLAPLGMSGCVASADRAAAAAERATAHILLDGKLVTTSTRVTPLVAAAGGVGLAGFATGNQMSAAPGAVVYDIVDQFLRGSAPGAGKDWIAILNKESQDRQTAASEAVAKAWESRNAKSTPSLPLEHFQYDTFIARWTDRRLMADAYVTFLLGADGTIEGIRMKAVSPATDFSYDFHDLDLERVPPEPVDVR